MTDVIAGYVWNSGLPPPPDGHFMSDSRNWSGAATLTFSDVDSSGLDLSPTFTDMQVGDTIRAQQETNANNWRLWTVGSLPAQNPDYSWAVAVTQASSSGTNISNGQPVGLTFSLAATVVEPDVAIWNMLPDQSNHWWSVVDCPHGHSQSGVWLAQEILDDRNFLAQAPRRFANHQALYPDCDCVLEIGYAPTFSPDVAQTAAVATRTVPTPRSPLASFEMLMMNANNVPGWWEATETCPHGTTLHGIWMGQPSMPDVLAVQAEQELNHQRVVGCDCTIAPPSTQVTATASLEAVTVQADATIAIAQSVGQAGTGFGTDGDGRLSVTVAGAISVTAVFTLHRSVADGGGGFAALRLPAAADPDLTDPSVNTTGVIDDPNGTATATLLGSWAVPAGTSIEVDYWNGTGIIEDIQGGQITVVLNPS